jgi:hypothetical protein
MKKVRLVVLYGLATIGNQHAKKQFNRTVSTCSRELMQSQADASSKLILMQSIMSR